MSQKTSEPHLDALRGKAKASEGCSVSSGVMDVTGERNSFGRQVNSFEADLAIKDVAGYYPAVFYSCAAHRESRSGGWNPCQA